MGSKYRRPDPGPHGKKYHETKLMTPDLASVPGQKGRRVYDDREWDTDDEHLDWLLMTLREGLPDERARAAYDKTHEWLPTFVRVDDPVCRMTHVCPAKQGQGMALTLQKRKEPDLSNLTAKYIYALASYMIVQSEHVDNRAMNEALPPGPLDELHRSLSARVRLMVASSAAAAQQYSRRSTTAPATGAAAAQPRP